MEERMKNVFIEGIQGMGKSFLIQETAAKVPGFYVCREGDHSPLDLAWCAWMTDKEYQGILEQYETIREEILKYTVKEGDHYITAYTKILTDIPGFHRHLEQYEIYNGRKSLQELEDIVLSRYRQFCGSGYLFECAFMQNLIEEFILFQQLSDDEITAFYHRLYGTVRKENFLLLYLYSEDIETSTQIIRKERSDEQGNELWYPLMLSYLADSPYGRQNGCQGFSDLTAHFRHRQQLELRIINEVVREHAVILPAKQWDIKEVLRLTE